VKENNEGKLKDEELKKSASTILVKKERKSKQMRLKAI